ncbi:hypothetical protein [Streptomyces sp. S1]|uniref:hypothetical protein n=1 Tax=Streptomyces sp. S1 TaxID=718288 RepID=UPI003D7603B2
MNWRPFFWWSADDLTDRWQILYRGEDEYHWRTLGVRLPFGVLFLRTGFCYRCADEAENLRVWGRPEGPTEEEARELNEDIRRLREKP